MQGSRGLMFAAVLLAGLGAHAGAGVEAQASKAVKTQARFIGGFHPDECRYPRQQRIDRVSACCIMDLDIDAAGHVVKSEGTCTNAAFLEPTQRCLAAHAFVPASVNGQPVRAQQSLEYEWRAEGPVTTSLCKPLRTS